MPKNSELFRSLYREGDRRGRFRCVYAYLDPRNGEPFYIGRSGRGRETEHMHPHNLQQSAPLYARLRSILDAGSEPIVVRLLDNLTLTESQYWEQFFILAIGCLESSNPGPLTNDKDYVSEHSSIRLLIQRRRMRNERLSWIHAEKQALQALREQKQQIRELKRQKLQEAAQARAAARAQKRLEKKQAREAKIIERIHRRREKKRAREAVAAECFRKRRREKQQLREAKIAERMRPWLEKKLARQIKVAERAAQRIPLREINKLVYFHKTKGWLAKMPDGLVSVPSREAGLNLIGGK